MNTAIVNHILPQQQIVQLNVTNANLTKDKLALETKITALETDKLKLETKNEFLRKERISLKAKNGRLLRNNEHIDSVKMFMNYFAVWTVVVCVIFGGMERTMMCWNKVCLGGLLDLHGNVRTDIYWEFSDTIWFGFLMLGQYKLDFDRHNNNNPHNQIAWGETINQRSPRMARNKLRVCLLDATGELANANATGLIGNNPAPAIHWSFAAPYFRYAVIGAIDMATGM